MQRPKEESAVDAILADSTRYEGRRCFKLVVGVRKSSILGMKPRKYEVSRSNTHAPRNEYVSA